MKRPILVLGISGTLRLSCHAMREYSKSGSPSETRE